MELLLCRVFFLQIVLVKYAVANSVVHRRPAAPGTLAVVVLSFDTDTGLEEGLLLNLARVVFNCVTCLVPGGLEVEIFPHV